MPSVPAEQDEICNAINKQQNMLSVPAEHFVGRKDHRREGSVPGERMVMV